MSSFAPIQPQFRRAPMAACPAQACTIRLSIDARSVTMLRQLAMRLCGDAFEFMRIALCAGGARIQVWLCVRRPYAAALSENIVRQFPGALLESGSPRAGAAA